VEDYAIIVLSGGLTLAALAWIWLLARAFEQHAGWGITSLLVPPLALVFALRHAQKAVGPLVIFVLGGIVAAAPAAYSLLGPSDLSLRQQLHQEPQVVSLVKTALESDAVQGWIEGRAYFMQRGGIALASLAWIWLLVRAFRVHPRWGLGSFVFPPLGFIFAGRYPRKGAGPLGLFMVCLLVAAAPAIYRLTVPLDRHAHERDVGSEKHLTLTGSDRKSNPDLKQKQDVAVLQMANADVTDQSLESLREMKTLRELDLNGTQITDAGLEILKGLPALTALRLARTKITDKGFRSALFAKESLMQLDLRDTAVSRETIQAWHDAKPGRHVSQ
jgi:Leucine Rich repeat